MSDSLKVELAEIESSQAYKDGDQNAVDRAAEIYSELYPSSDGEAGLTPLQRTMKEALDGDPLPDPDRRAVAEPQVTQGDVKWGEPLKRDEHGKEVTIMERPDLYQIDPDTVITRQEEIDALETNEDIKEYLAKEGVHLDDTDLENMDRLVGIGENLGFTEDEVRAAFNTVVRSPIYGETFTNEEGAQYLLDKVAHGDHNLARSILDRSKEVLGRMDSQTRAYLEETGLGNHPDVICALAGFAESKWGSAVDDPGALQIDYPDED